MYAGYSVWDIQVILSDSHTHSPSYWHSIAWGFGYRKTKVAQGHTGNESFFVDEEGESVCVNPFPSTYRQRRKSLSLLTSSLTRNFNCATLSTSIETSFFTRSDYLVTTMLKGMMSAWLQGDDNLADTVNASMVDFTVLLLTLSHSNALETRDV